MKRRRSGRIQRAAACFLAAAVLTAAGAGNALAEEERAECCKGRKCGESRERRGAGKKTEPIGTAQPAAVESAPSAAENPTPGGTEDSGTEADGAGEAGTEGKTPAAEGKRCRRAGRAEPGGTGTRRGRNREDPDRTMRRSRERKNLDRMMRRKPETEEPGQGGADLPGMDIVIPVAIPLSSGAEYDQLSTFLSLSSDRFCGLHRSICQSGTAAGAAGGSRGDRS